MSRTLRLELVKLVMQPLVRCRRAGHAGVFRVFGGTPKGTVLKTLSESTTGAPPLSTSGKEWKPSGYVVTRNPLKSWQVGARLARAPAKFLASVLVF